MDLEKRIELIKKPPTEEIIREQELRELLETKQRPVAYDGFEPSGFLHLGSGVLRAIKLQDMIEAGIKFKLLIADWFAWINEKLGGDLEKIQKAGKYMVEGWKACGVDIKKIEIVWTSDIAKDLDYWKGMITAAKLTTINRAVRTAPIMGRKEVEMMFTAQLFYPFMQAYDPIYMDVDILQLGMDQRRVTILTRELAPKLKKVKPVLVHHHLLIGLLGPGHGRMGQEQVAIEAKMSKSKPESAIFIHDENNEIKRKINAAYCPPKIVEGNSILEICKYVIFRKVKIVEVGRPKKLGERVEFWSYEDLEKEFREGKLHPADLKNAVTEELIKILEPVRKYFERNKEAKELLEFMKQIKVTR